MAYVAVISLLFSVLPSILCNADQSVNTFDVNPGGSEYKATTSLKQVQCVFKYRSQGGTSEAWRTVVTALEEHNGQYTCTVERPNSLSYLYFEEFSLDLTSESGPLDVIPEKCIVESNEGTVLSPAEYDLASGIMRSSKNFNNALAKATLVASFAKEEL